MREYGQEPQVVITMPILEGLDGVEKMSKSLGNYIGINEDPQSIFGKVMSISDDLMWKYYTLCTDLTPSEIAARKSSLHPMEAKRELAKSIIRDFHDASAADAAEESFRRVFSERQAPAEMEEVTLPASPEPQLLSRIIVSAGLAESNKEAQRVISQGGVLVDDTKINDPRATLDATAGKSYVLKVGKRRFGRVRFA
jgi:tyrosyl-tRNA synthetase